MPVEARVSLPFDDVVRVLAARPGFAWLDGDGSPRGERSFVLSDPVERRVASADPLGPFRDLVHEPGGHPRYVGYVPYEAAVAAFRGHPFEGSPRTTLHRYDAVFAHDVRDPGVRIIADDDAALGRALARLEGPFVRGDAAAGDLDAEADAAHHARIEAVLSAIAAGELYQVNLARRFEAPFEGSPFALAAALREASPVPFGFVFDDDARVILGRSMERFLAFDAATRALETRPIKGTIARGPEGAAAALASDPKEHAEHTMVVDLLRNDLGRVAEVGTVRVAEAYATEPYARLVHLVSSVRCVVREGLGAADVLAATLPPGSVTGTPKSRALRFIEALEAGTRGVYCGAYGYVAADGSFDFAVAIRTAVLESGRLAYHAGGGIVAGSEPERECAETELKTRVLREALDRLDGRNARPRGKETAPARAFPGSSKGRTEDFESSNDGSNPSPGTD